MGSFIDARCPKCDRKQGWFGDLKDRPPGPKCGHQVPKAELDAAEAEMKAVEDRLRKEMGDS